MTDKNIDRIVNETVTRLVNEEGGFLKGLRRTGSAISDLSGLSNRFREFEKNHPKTTDFMQRFFMIKPEAEKDTDRMRYVMRAIMKFVRQNGQDFTIACKQFINSIKQVIWRNAYSVENGPKSRFTILGKGGRDTVQDQYLAQGQPQQQVQQQAQMQQQPQQQMQYPQFQTTSTAQYNQQQLQEQEQPQQQPQKAVCTQFYNECVNLINACYKFLMKWGSDDGISEDDMLTSVPSSTYRTTRTDREYVKQRLDYGNIGRNVVQSYDNFEDRAQECYGMIQSHFSQRTNLSSDMMADAVSEFANDFNNIEQLYSRLIDEWWNQV